MFSASLYGELVHLEPSGDSEPPNEWNDPAHRAIAAHEAHCGICSNVADPCPELRKLIDRLVASGSAS